MNGRRTRWFKPVLAPVFFLLLSMLCACGLRSMVTRSNQPAGGPKGPRYAADDPQQYQVRDYGTITLHRKTLPKCPFDTIRTVVTGQMTTQEEATEALLDLAMLHEGRAVISVVAETIVVSQTLGGSLGKSGKDPTFDSGGRLVKGGSLPEPKTAGSWAMNMKFRYHGTVVRYRKGDCNSEL